MATIDWKDVSQKGRMRAFRVNPSNFDDVMYELEGIDWSRSTINAAYYTDARTSAKLIMYGDKSNMKDYNAWIRLFYEIPDYGFRYNFGTYVITEDPTDYANGAWTYSIALSSVMWTLGQVICPSSWTIKKGATTSQCFQKMFDWCKVRYRIDSINNYTADRNYTLTFGKTALEWLYLICKHSYNRLDMDGFGRVLVNKWVKPANIAQKMTLDLSDPNGLVIDGLTRKTDYREIPGRVIIHHSVGSGDDAQDIIAYADATGSSSWGSRGYLKGDYTSLTDMSPETYQEALRRAQKRLAEQTVQQIEWTVQTPFLPIWEGEGITLITPDVAYSGNRKCFVKSLEINDLHLGRPTMQMVLKECASGDKGDEYE